MFPNLFVKTFIGHFFAARLMLEEDPTLYNSMNALVQWMTARRIWQVIYSQLGLEGSVDVSHFESLECRFWHRKAA